MSYLKELIKAARGEEPADLVLKGGRVVNVFSGEIERLDVAVKDGLIAGLGRYDGYEEINLEGKLLSPGLIEPHLHIESTLLCPAQLAEVVVPRGTTTIIADPHEIANVLGLDGIRFMLKASEGLPMDIFFMAPSCVPASRLETAGAELTAEDLMTLLDEPRILGLAEMMNFPGVINHEPPVLAKLEVFSARPIDGHAPLLSGNDLNAYISAGISTDHECTVLSEAREKLARGMRVLIREGSTARNMAELLPLVTENNFRRIGFCSDDRHANDLIEEGHLDRILRKAVNLGLDPVRALIMASHNAAEAYSLPKTGAIAPGYHADMVILDSLETYNVDRVYKAGRLVSRDGQLINPIPALSIPDSMSPMNTGPLDLQSLEVKITATKARAIELIEGQILTGSLIVETPGKDGFLRADTKRDLARLVVVERHKATGNIGQALVKGFGLQKGALASSIAHDSHNIISVGISSGEILTAIKAVEEMHGGLAVAVENQILACLPLPVAGLMSPAPAREVAADYGKLETMVRETGCALENPFMALSFLALPVIPSLKLTDKGLVDVDAFDFVDLFVN
jgi:adenine deaminase